MKIYVDSENILVIGEKRASMIEGIDVKVAQATDPQILIDPTQGWIAFSEITDAEDSAYESLDAFLAIFNPNRVEYVPAVNEMTAPQVAVEGTTITATYSAPAVLDKLVDHSAAVAVGVGATKVGASVSAKASGESAILNLTAGQKYKVVGVAFIKDAEDNIIGAVASKTAVDATVGTAAVDTVSEDAEDEESAEPAQVESEVQE